MATNGTGVGRGEWAACDRPGALTSMSQTLKSASIIKSHPRRSKMPEVGPKTVTASDSTHQSAPDQHGHQVEHGTQRVRGGGGGLSHGWS